MPNPEDKGAVEATRAAVLATGADLGIMLDTDVDRSGVVDSAGGGTLLGPWETGPHQMHRSAARFFAPARPGRGFQSVKLEALEHD